MLSQLSYAPACLSQVSWLTVLLSRTVATSLILSNPSFFVKGFCKVFENYFAEMVEIDSSQKGCRIDNIWTELLL